MNGLVDLSRAFALPDNEDYRGLAYDCETFPVPVVWPGYVFNCELVAFEVESRSPCATGPSPRILRAGTAIDTRASKLPLITANDAWDPTILKAVADPATGGVILTE